MYVVKRRNYCPQAVSFSLPNVFLSMHDLQFELGLIQFLLGVWLFHEAFTAERLVGFLLIWSALALYAAEGLWRNRKPAT